jgi:hypothetical protein
MQLHTIGIDLGKTVFHLVGLNLRGEVVVRKKFSRKQLLHFTANQRRADAVAVYAPTKMSKRDAVCDSASDVKIQERPAHLRERALPPSNHKRM